MIGDFLEVRTPDGFTFWDFEKKVIKSELRKTGNDVAKEARQRIRDAADQNFFEPIGEFLPY